MAHSQCTEAAQALEGWLLLLMIVPSVINMISIALLIVSMYMVRRLHSVAENISASTHWLMRTAVRVGIGPKAKRALMEYARTKPNLAHLVQLPADEKNE